MLSLVIAVQAQEIPERKTEHPPMQGRGMHGKMKGKHDRHEMMKQLNLTEDQKAKFKAQKEAFHKQMEELKKNDNITVKEWKNKMETLRKDQRTKMESLLTAEQKTKMEQLKKDGQAKHEEMRKQHFEKMKTDLGLSQEQAAKMEKQRAEMDQQLKTLRENKNLSDDQRKEQMKELMKQRKENMKSILTEEQQKKMKENRQQHPGMHEKRKNRQETI